MQPPDMVHIFGHKQAQTFKTAFSTSPFPKDGSNLQSMRRLLGLQLVSGLSSLQGNIAENVFLWMTIGLHVRYSSTNSTDHPSEASSRTSTSEPSSSTSQYNSTCPPSVFDPSYITPPDQTNVGVRFHEIGAIRRYAKDYPCSAPSCQRTHFVKHDDNLQETPCEPPSYAQQLMSQYKESYSLNHVRNAKLHVNRRPIPYPFSDYQDLEEDESQEDSHDDVEPIVVSDNRDHTLHALVTRENSRRGDHRPRSHLYRHVITKGKTDHLPNPFIHRQNDGVATTFCHDDDESPDEISFDEYIADIEERLDRMRQGSRDSRAQVPNGK